MCVSSGDCAYSLRLDARVCDCGGRVTSVRMCEKGAPCDTLPLECGPGSQHPRGLGEAQPLPRTWSPEPGATSEPHQHQAHPSSQPGWAHPRLYLRSEPSLWLVGAGVTCFPHLAPITASTGKQGSRPFSLATFCTGITTAYTRCPQLNLATWPGARGHHLPPILWCPSTAQGFSLGRASANVTAQPWPALRSPAPRPGSRTIRS